jgi:hypothetical protein
MIIRNVTAHLHAPGLNEALVPGGVPGQPVEFNSRRAPVTLRSLSRCPPVGRLPDVAGLGVARSFVQCFWLQRDDAESETPRAGPRPRPNYSFTVP